MIKSYKDMTCSQNTDMGPQLAVFSPSILPSSLGPSRAGCQSVPRSSLLVSLRASPFLHQTAPLATPMTGVTISPGRVAPS